jgi:bifunctional DNase/RNase
MQKMQVAGIGLDAARGQAVLLLQESEDPHRVLPVWVGLPEAVAIDRESRHQPAPRPPTHQLIGDVVRAFGRRLDEVRITELRGGVFFAELALDHQATVSARVSDAVALAVHLDVPIYAAEAVLDEAAHDVPTDVAEKSDVPSEAEQADEIERFRRLLDTASPEDFER